MNECGKDFDKAEGAMKVLKVIGMIILGIAALFAFGLVVMLLWNWLMPLIFNLTTLTYWQSLGVLALCVILFGRIGGGSGSEDKKNKKRPIRDSIKDEIKKEFEKEFAKEKQAANENYDDMYDKWWNEEGESLFEKYMSSKEKL